MLPFYPLFLAGMNLVVVADDAFVFLFAWEFMSIASWFLVMADHRDPDNRHAGYVYLIMAVLSTLLLLVAFGLLSGPGGHLDFASMRAAKPAIEVARLIALAAVLGAGAKAGLVPLHAWSHTVSDALHIARVLQQEAPGAFQVVAPDEFVGLIIDNIRPT